MPNYIKLGNLRIEIPAASGGGGGGGGGGSSSLFTGLLAFYNLSDLTDASGNNRTLTNNGGVTFSSGKIGNAAVFNSSNYLSRSENPLFGANVFSISAWIKTTDSGYQGIFEGFSDTATLWLSPNGLTFDATSGGAARLTVSGEYNNGSWHHLVGVYNGATSKIYVDGVEVGSLETNVTPNWSSGSTYYGGAPGFWRSNKEIDALGLWSRALTSAEITELYNAGAGKEHPFA